MNKRSFVLFLMLSLVFSTGVAVTSWGADIAPKELRASTSPLTTGNTIQLMAVAPEFQTIMGIKLRAIPTDTLLASFMGIKTNVTDIWVVHVGSAYRAIFGVEEYCTPELGPQPLRITWKGSPFRFSMISRGDSNIKTLADLKGKKVAVYAGGEGYVGACLAFAGLTLNDIQRVPATGYAGALEQVQRGHADSAFCASNYDSKEIAASPGGVKYLPIPHSNKEGWKRLQKVYPALLPYKVPEITGQQKEAWGIEMLGFPAGVHTLATEELTTGYAVAKVYAEGYNAYKDRHAELKFWTIEEAVACLDVPWPYDEGAIKYFKEKGLWTKAHEDWQKDKIRLEKARKDAWAKALADAKAKGMKTTMDNQAWQEFWKGYLLKIE